MPQDKKQHQQELAASGYRLPDTLYVAPPGADLQSAEETSGDGGKAAGELESDIGYQGALATPEEVRLDAEKLRTVDPKTGRTIPGEVERQAEAARTGKPLEPKNGAQPAENKAASEPKATASKQPAK